MRKLFSKYFVIILSLLLVLSNFSYASSLMLCQMSDESAKCECRHDDPQPLKDISFTKERSACCENETTELSNTNTLQTVKTELPKYTAFSAFSAMDFQHNLLVQFNQFILSAANKEHVPKRDIPILTSSLLI